jgi:outer membrane receptor protein involved in Fe transport
MIAFVCAIVALAFTQAASLTGTVRDTTGSVVPGATVIVQSAAGPERQTLSGPDGRFKLAIGSGDVTLVVRAGGFAEFRRSVSATEASSPIDVELSPGRLTDTVTVTAVRDEQRTGDVPASVTVLDAATVRQSPAVVADDVLRQVPTFSLFRRTSSLAAHPTAQGVSLRGIGPSGVSRTLVLLDDVPFNDPFGGWVYWTRIPLNNTERIEIVDGPSSSLYGNYAMGGVINIMSAPASREMLDVRAQYGSRRTPRVDVTAGHVWGALGVLLNASALETDGYPIVIAAERGAVDNNAAVKYRNVSAKADYQASSRVRTFVRVGHFREDRDNGKASTIDGTEEANHTRWTSVNGGARVQLPAGELRATIFSDSSEFRSNFLAVPAATPARSVGRMTLNQVVPVDAIGTTVQFTRGFHRHSLTAGFDWRRVDGDSVEDALDATTGSRVTLHRVSGGTQRIAGFYLQDIVQPLRRLTITASTRVDSWRNYDGHNLETAIVPGTATNNIPSLAARSDTVNSPRVAALVHMSDAVSVWAGGGAGFRAPTLNELYRQFRVGQTLTLANNDLGPERLLGFEGGVVASPRPHLTLRLTTFKNRLKDPISNVTIATSGSSVTQQRQNLGRTRVRGFQTDVDYRVATSWQFGAAYVFNHATVTENAAVPDLVDKFLPQVPRHRGSARAAYVHPAHGTYALSLQFAGGQFDDDRNTATRRLPAYVVTDFSASKSLRPGIEAFFGVQNLFNREFLVGTLPTTIGAPRLVTAGVRFSLSPR